MQTKMTKAESIIGGGDLVSILSSLEPKTIN